MAKYELAKSVEAARLNKRTGHPLAEPTVTIPYGAIISDLEESGDFYKYAYMVDRYQTKRDTMAGGFHLLAGSSSAASSAVVDEQLPLAETAPASDEVAGPLLRWERLRVAGGPAVTRARVPGGWLVSGGSSGGSLAFVPDLGHGWDGGSV
jgi:hypothetical protein